MRGDRDFARRRTGGDDSRLRACWRELRAWERAESGWWCPRAEVAPSRPIGSSPANLPLATWSATTGSKLDRHFPRTHQNNPVDLGAHFGALGPHIFRDAIEAVADDANMAAFIYIMTPQPLMPQTAGSRHRCLAHRNQTCDLRARHLAFRRRGQTTLAQGGHAIRDSH